MKLKKILASILALCMVLSTMSFAVSANESAEEITASTEEISANSDLVEVATYDELIAAVAGDAKTIIMMKDIEGDATQSNGYGKTGISILNGETLDGNGYTLTISGLNGTWDSAISTTGGIIKNLTVDKGFRGIFINHNSDYSDIVVLENVTIDGPTYTVHCDQGENKGLVANNCTINGWTSFAATIGSAEFNNCTFGKGAGYQFCRPYIETTFTGCEFNAGFEVDTKRAIHTFNECTYDGKSLGTNNINKLFPYSGSKIFIDDEEVTINQNAVAYIGLTGYENLDDAIKAAVDGDTITLTEDCSEDITVSQAPEIKIVIDGNGNTMSGSITVDGKSKRYETAALTIRNIKFDAAGISKDASINLGGNNSIRYTSNVTVDNCTFTGTDNAKVGIKQYTGGCHNLVVTGCDATGMHSLIQLKNVEEGLVITDCEIKDSKNGISIGKSTGVKIEECDINVSGYGIRADGEDAYTASVKNCSISAELPVVVRKTTADYSLTLEGTNELTASNTSGYQVVFTMNDDDQPLEQPESNPDFSGGKNLKVYPEALCVVQLGDVQYTSLQTAMDAAGDGDTIKLLGNLTITDSTRVHNSADWYDGVYYLGDKDITLDLNGYTLTHDGSVNDYLLNFKNMGEKANEITITNGTIDAGTNAFCAICTSSTSTQKMTINTENVTIIGNHPNGAVIKPRGYNTTANIKSGTKIIGKDSYAAIESSATVNIYEGAELYQNGTSSYMGAIIGVSGDGVANIYGGKGVSANSGIIAMSSGGTINVSGGEWKSLTTNTQQSILSAQNDKGAYPSGVDSVINVSGGKFSGHISAWTHGRDNEVSKINIVGGMFDQDPNAYVATDYEVIPTEVAEYPYVVVSKTASNVKVEFVPTQDASVYDIKLVSTDAYAINEFVGAELTFENTSKTVAGEDLHYEILGIAGKTDVDTNTGKEYTYAIRLIDSVVNDGINEMTGTELLIGQVKFIGQGTVNFKVTEGTVAATQFGKTLERYYIADGDAATEDTLVLDNSKITNGVIVESVGTVVVNVAYNHALVGNWEGMGNQITVTLKDAFGNVTDAKDISDGSETFTNVKVGKVIVTLEAPGYRKTVYQTNIDEDGQVVELNFWNEVKRGTTQSPLAEIEVGKGFKAKNFVVGDIVMDYIVDEYDLAAVTSYYGTYNLTEDKYIQYDLNRDGNIDIIDVAYVLHSYAE